MKKRIITIAILVALNLTSVGICGLAVNGSAHINPLPQAYTEKINNYDEFKEFYEINIDRNSKDEEQVDKLVEHLFNIQPYLYRLNVNFKLMDKQEMMVYARDNKISPFSGLFNPETNEIIIVGDDMDTSVHEVGHAIYFQLLNDVNRVKVKNLFNKESNLLLDEYGRTSPEEFFAVAFTEYIYSPETLKKNCPEIHDFLNGLNTEVN